MTSGAPGRWDAATYHVISNPHVTWGRRVLERLALTGHETVLDAGCGTGRLTALLLERLPEGHVVALDRDPGMLAQAREHLAPFGSRVSFVEGSLLAMPASLSVDAVFSTATFHWVLDHDALFASLARVLRPGGRLVAQCGGQGNLAHVLARVDAILDEPPFRAYLGGVPLPWTYAAPDATRARLERAGFVDVETSLEQAPTPFASADEYRMFVDRVVLGVRLAPLTDQALHAELVDRVVAAAEHDTPPFSLDYVRLNLSGRKA